jgi:F-type H+-transporting ATPase subunit alpha
MTIERNLLVNGVVITNGSGVISLQGFLTAFVGEVFEINVIHSGIKIGVVVNLHRDETMNLTLGALLLDPSMRVSEGSSVRGLSRLASILLGDFVIGSILDPIGNIILNSSTVEAQYPWVIESPAPGIIDRQSVFESLQTGILSVDAMVPIGRGQRELIVGDRQTGKTAIGVDTILNQRLEQVFCVYLPIGSKCSSILEVFLTLVSRECIGYSSLLVASASSSACAQYLSAYTGAALSEFFCIVGQLASFLMYDDLSRHAVSYREIYLLLRRPPGREAYPGEIFFVHSRLLERGSKLSTNLGGGSVTCFPVIETLAADVSAYITTNVISITDGQIFLSTDLFLSGIKPSIDVGLSVTRVGSSAQWNGMKLVAGSYKLELAQFVELQAFSQFASDLGAETKQKLDRGKRLVNILVQPCGDPIRLSSQLMILSIANQDIVKQIPVECISDYVRNIISIPVWVSLTVSARVMGLSMVNMVMSNLLTSESSYPK